MAGNVRRKRRGEPVAKTVRWCAERLPCGIGNRVHVSVEIAIADARDRPPQVIDVLACPGA